jgi:Hg(II)-responsive transcriptional regulator
MPAVNTRTDTQAPAPGLTIGRLARAASVGVETVRYYQRRKLLPVPAPGDTNFRFYPPELVERIRFIKRAQDLGFTLDEIAALLQLENSADHKAIREVAQERLDQIRAKMADLQRMEVLLSHLIDECEASGQHQPCPIIKAFAAQAAPACAHC